jgi:hypothetical protein
MWNRDQILSVENPGSQKWNGDGGLESRLARARHVWNQGDERAIDVIGWNADDQCWPNLRCHTEINPATLRLAAAKALGRLATVELNEEAICCAGQIVVMRQVMRLKSGTT